MGEDETAAPKENGHTSPTNGCEGEAEGLIIAPIEVIIPGVFSDDEEEEAPKKKKKKKGKKNKVDKTMVLTKTFGQALRLINEQKVSLQLLIVKSVYLQLWSVKTAPL